MIYTTLLYNIESHMICIILSTTFQSYIGKKMLNNIDLTSQETGKVAISHVI